MTDVGTGGASSLIGRWPFGNRLVDFTLNAKPVR
jgi:hypothetical protein